MKTSLPKENFICNLTSLDTESASEISKLPILEIRFEYLSSLSRRSASILSTCQFAISMPKVESLSKESAEALSKHESSLILDGICEITSDLAEALAQHVGPLSLSGVTEICAESARKLAAHRSGISLAGIEQISDEAVESLSHYIGTLNLSGIKRITESQARYLGEQKGNLILNGLQELSDSVAEFLAKHEGPLNLDGIKSLSAAAVEMLSDHCGYLSVNGIEYGDKSVAKLIKNHQGTVRLFGLLKASPQLVTVFEENSYRPILNDEMSSFENVVINAKKGNTEAQLRLAYYFEVGQIVPKDLENSKRWYDFAAQQGEPIAMFKIGCLSNKESLVGIAVSRLINLHGEVDLSGIRHLTCEEAHFISNLEGVIDLGGLNYVLDDVAASLASAQAVLKLNGITRLLDHTADAFSKIKSPLDLRGLVDCTPRSIRKLADCGNIAIPELLLSKIRPEHITSEAANLFLENPNIYDISFATYLDDEAADILSEKECDLFLDSICSLTDISAAALSKHIGHLSLMNLYEISKDAVVQLAGHLSPVEFSEHFEKSILGECYQYFRLEILRKFNNIEPDGFSRITSGWFSIGRDMTLSERILLYEWDKPKREIYLSDFYMAKHVVTKFLWDKVRNWAIANGYIDLPENYSLKNDHPADRLNWFDCVKWCNAYSEMLWLDPCYSLSNDVYKFGESDHVQVNWKANGFRLPTEAEWEKAARGGLKGKRFPWGDTISHEFANYKMGYERGQPFDFRYPHETKVKKVTFHPKYYSENNHERYGLAPVGSFPPNNYGLYEMSGNQNEWCWDWYVSDYYKVCDSNNPRGPSLDYAMSKSSTLPGGSQSLKRVYRGGKWDSTGVCCEVDGRIMKEPGDSRRWGMGFRLVRGY